MLSDAEAKKQRRELLRDIAAEHLRKDREKLARLREKIRSVKGRRKAALVATRRQCRAGARRARERAKARALAIRLEARNLVRAARLEEIQKARAVCRMRKDKVKAAALSARDKRRATLKAERDFQTEMRRIEGWTKRRKREEAKRTTAAERRQESDDAVRGNIPADLVPLFERVKRSIKGSTRQSRTEEFLHYAAEHPHEVVDAQMELSQREIAKLIHEEARLAKAVRRPKRYRPTAQELAAIPF